VVCDNDVKYTPGISRLCRAVWRLLSRKDDGEVKKGMMSGLRLPWLASFVDETGRIACDVWFRERLGGGEFLSRALCSLQDVVSVIVLGGQFQ